MTDRERLTALLDDFGINFVMENPDIIVIHAEGSHAKVDGYFGFFADFLFEADGTFKQMRILE